MKKDFKQELTELINKHGLEKEMRDTPDFILAQVCIDAMAVFSEAIARRDEWHEFRKADEKSSQDAKHNYPDDCNIWYLLLKRELMNMIMKQLNFKIVLLFLTIYVCPHRTLAQKDTLLYRTLIQDSILIPQKSQATIEEEEGIFTEVPKHYRKYDKRVHRYRSAWEALIPTHTKIQYAGGMGLLSWGIGWDYGKRGQWETDLLLGFIPRYSSRHFKMTMTLKQNFIPWSVYLGKDFSPGFNGRKAFSGNPTGFSCSCFMFLYFIIFEIYHNKCPKIMKN